MEKAKAAINNGKCGVRARLVWRQPSSPRWWGAPNLAICAEGNVSNQFL